MAKSNINWRKAGVIATIVFTCAGAGAGAIYSFADTKNLVVNNKEDITKLETKVEKGFDKMEKKMDEFSVEQTILKVQTAQILEMVKYLKEKAQ